MIRISVMYPSGEGTPRLDFDTLPDFERASAAHGKELSADVPNFTNIQPPVQTREVIG